MRPLLDGRRRMTAGSGAKASRRSGSGLLNRVLATAVSCALVSTMALPQIAYANPFEDAANAVVDFFTGGSTSEAPSPLSVDDPSNLVSDTRSPANASLNLFDYWISDENAVDKNDPSGWENMGINEGKQLRFSDAGRYDRPDTGSINGWTGKSGKPLTGIVQNRLDANGYPVLEPGNLYQAHSYQGQKNLVTDAQSLAYLFDETNMFGKRAYRDVRGMVQYENGYYVYDSSKNYAAYNRDTGNLSLYKQPAVSNDSGSIVGQFFPFDPGSEVFEERDGAIVPKNIKSTTEGMNHYFGAELTANFVQLPGGVSGDDHVVFNFAGDDDVWVFVDGVLVGDVGGVHGAASLSIDFATGEVVVKDNRKNPPQTYEPMTTTIRQCYETALGVDAAQGYLQEGTETLKDGSFHTLKFFYLERGNTDSNMALTFNLPEIAESKIEKDDQDGEKVAGAQFELWRAVDDGNGGYLQTGSDPISTAQTDANGSFTLMTPDGSRPLDFSELASKGVDRFILRETAAPEGYRTSLDAHLRYVPSKGDGLNGFLVSENCFDSGVYARPNQITKVNATGKVKTADEAGKPEQEFTVDENVTVFAVLYKYDRSNTKQWYSVSGSRDNWVVSDKPAGSIADLNALCANGSAHMFELDGDSYAANLGEMPGDPEDYKFMAAPDNEHADYSIGYYLTTMPRDQLKKEVAAGKNPLNENNTFWLDSSGKKGNFIRDTYSTLHVTDIASGITVQKVDDDMAPVNGATFALYSAEQMNEGATAPLAGQIPVAKGVTSNMLDVDSVHMDGAVRFSKLAYGTYYLVEEDVPEGYIKNEKPVRVICDRMGSFADAGSEADGIEVLAGIGSLVDAMSLFGSNDQIEVTLHDVIAKKYVANCVPASPDASANEYVIQSWEPAMKDQAAPDLHLRYDDASHGHGYVPNDEKADPPASAYFTTDTAMIGAAVFQDPDPASDKHGMGTWENLGGKDLTNLFTGSTVVRVTNERVASLEVSKRVEIPEGLLGPENIADKDFTFTFSFSKDGAPLQGDFTARVFKASEQNGSLQQVGEDFKIHDGSTHTLKDGETIRVYGLPDGASYKVEEPASSMPPGFVQIAPHDQNDAPESAEGTIVSGSTEQRLFVNSYNPIPAQIAPAQLGVEKTFSSTDGKNPWETAPKASFTFVLQQLTTDAPMPDGSQPGPSGALEKSIVIDASDKGNAYREFFDPVRFTKQGTYYYAVFERTPNADDRIPGVSYSDAAFIVSVEVTDDRNGALSAKVAAAQTDDDAGQEIAPTPVDPQPNGSIVLGFENSLSRTSVSMGPLASKVLTGRDFSSDQTGEFVFRMKPVGEHAADQPMPEGSTGAGADRVMEVRNSGASIGFGRSLYEHGDLDKAPYYYELWEEAPADAVNAQGVTWGQATPEQKEAGGFKKDGVTYDSRHFVAKVSLGTSGDKNEFMTAKIEYFQGSWQGSPDGLTPVPPTESGAADKVLFENAYEAEGSFAGIQVAKELLGRDMKADEFRFSIEGVDEASSAKLAEGDKSFGVADTPKNTMCKMGPKLALSFTQADAGKSYSFMVSENPAALDGNPLSGVVYDKSKYLVTIEVSDNGDGTLSTVPTVLLETDSDGNHRHEQLDLSVILDKETGLYQLDFVNKYHAASAYSGITVTKTMQGKDMPGDEFVFGIEPKTDDARMKMYVDRDPSVDLSQETLFSAPAYPNGVATSMGPKLAVDFTAADVGKHFEYEVFEAGVPSDDDPDIPGVQKRGVTYDMSRFRVTMDVADKGDSTLRVVTRVERTHDKVSGQPLSAPELVGEYTSDDPSRIPDVPFLNSYKAAPVSANAELLAKAIDGRGWMPQDGFTFHFEQTAFHDFNGVTYKPGDAGYVAGPVIPDAVVDMQSTDGYWPGTKEFGFTGAVFDTVGMYRYEVSEVVPDDAVNADGVSWGEASDEQKLAGGFKKDGMTYSSEKATVSVSIWDYGNGELIATPSVSDPKPGETANFVNVYDAQGASLSTSGLFSKKLTGREWLDSDSFSFEMRAVEPADAPMPDVAVDGVVSVTLGRVNADSTGVASFGFGDITYTAADLADAAVGADGSRSKDFVYEVSEVIPDDAVNADGVSWGQATEEQKQAGGFKKDGVSYDGHRVRFAVTLADDGKGGLSATHKVEGESSGTQFVNDYVASLDYATHAGINIAKTLTGRDMAAGQFEFTVTAIDSDTVSANEAAVKMGFDQGSVSRVFAVPAADDGAQALIDIVPDGVTFGLSDVGKTFAYEVSETKGGDAGYTNDETTYTVTVAIEDTGQGALRATTTVWDGKGGEQSYVSDNGATDPIVAVVPFENAYNAAGQFAIEGSKKLTGRPLVADEFAFSLSLMPADGNTDKPAKEIEDIKNAADGSVVFTSVSFDVKSLEALVDEGYAVKSAADTGAAWKLRYRVAEDLSALPDGTGAVSDSFEAQVTLTDDGKGVLNAVVTYPQQGGVIENAYAAGEKALFVPRGTKQLSHLPGLRPNDIAGKFTFTLEGEEGAPMPQAPGDTAVNDEAGNVTFGSIEFTTDMLADVEPASDGTRSKEFVYHVRESVTPGADVSGVTNDAQVDKAFTVTLHDDGKGNLSVVGGQTDEPLFSFTNTYAAGSVDSSVTDAIRVSKSLTGRALAEGEFEFALVDATSGVSVATAKNAADGSVAFPAISYEKPGEHTYRLYEVKGTAEGVTYDDTEYVVRTVVADDGRGSLTATHELFTTDGKKAESAVFENAYEEPVVPVPPIPGDPDESGPSKPPATDDSSSGAGPAAQAQGGSFAATSDAVPGAVFVLLVTGIAAAIVVVAGTLKRRA